MVTMSHPLRFLHRRYLPPEPIMLLYFLSTMLATVVQQQFGYYRSCLYIAGDRCNYTLNKNESQHVCEENSDVDQIQAYASYLGMAMNLCSCVPTIFMSLILGPLSDYKGRKLAIFLPILGSFCYNIVNLAIDLFNLPPYYLLIGSLLLGLGGNYPVVTMATNAYLMDITPKRYRTVRLAVITTFSNIAGFLSNFFGGMLLERLGFRYMFTIIICLFGVTLVYTILISESVRKRQFNPAHSPQSDSIASNIKYFFLEMLKPFRLFYRNKNSIKFAILMIALASSLADIYGNIDLFALYALSPPLCWLPHLIGWYFAFGNLGYVFGIYLILPILLKFRVNDYIIIVISSIDAIFMYVLVGTFRSQLVLLIVVPVVGCLVTLANPCIRSVLVGLIERNESGSLFAIISVLTTTTQLLASVVYNGIYPTLRVYNPGLCFYLIAVTAIIPITLSSGLYLYETCYEKKREPTIDSNLNINHSECDLTDERTTLVNPLS